MMNNARFIQEICSKFRLFSSSIKFLVSHLKEDASETSKCEEITSNYTGVDIPNDLGCDSPKDSNKSAGKVKIDEENAIQGNIWNELNKGDDINEEEEVQNKDEVIQENGIQGNIWNEVNKDSCGMWEFQVMTSMRRQKYKTRMKLLKRMKSSSTSHMNCSGLYSFRDRRMVTKYRMAPLLFGFKKKVHKYENNSSSKTNMNAVLSNRDSGNDSKKQRKSSTEVEEEQSESEKKEATPCDKDSVVSSKLEYQEKSDSEKKRKGIEKIAAECENDSLGTILENQQIEQSKLTKEDVAADREEHDYWLQIG